MREFSGSEPETAALIRWILARLLLGLRRPAEALAVVPRLVLSNSNELRLPLRWVAILYGRLLVDLAPLSVPDLVAQTIATVRVEPSDPAAVVNSVSSTLVRGR